MVYQYVVWYQIRSRKNRMTAKVWITGPVQSGKTDHLVARLCQDAKISFPPISFPQTSASQASSGVAKITEFQPSTQRQSCLVFAMNADNRSTLTQFILNATAGQISLRSTTPLGFFEDEVTLFWPLIAPKLTHRGVPLRLRPETELHHAMTLWGQACVERLNNLERFSWERWARNLLDLIQLAAFSGIPLEQVGQRLSRAEAGSGWLESNRSEFEGSGFEGAGFAGAEWTALDWQWMNQLLITWRDWCLEQGLVTYGLVSELFWRYLLPDPRYQAQLLSRFSHLYADDVENYPAIAHDLFELCHELGIPGTYTFNPCGSLRLGLGGDPDTLLQLSRQAAVIPLSTPSSKPAQETVQSIQTQTRAQLLRETAETIVRLIQVEQVSPADIAVVGPGLDALARYALIEIIESHHIPVVSLKDQRPLNSSAIVRALLTLMTFVYKGLGDLVDQEAVAEMLGILTAYPLHGQGQARGLEHLFPPDQIDPVRAALLADYCFQPDRDNPKLLDFHAFKRWDRLGAQTAIAYTKIRHWIEQQRQALTPCGPGIKNDSLQTPSLQTPSHQSNPSRFLETAIHHFLGLHLLRYDQLAVLQELLETAQHYWEVHQRLSCQAITATDLAQFIGLLRRGVITANPAPSATLGIEASGVLLATAYQYRIARLAHPYHFWLDVGSPLWQQGSLITLWGYQSLMRSPPPNPLPPNPEDVFFRTQIQDLIVRAKHRLYLCHSELSVSGHEQMGALLPLVHGSDFAGV